MLSVFPTLLVYHMIGATIIRLILGTVLFIFALKKIRSLRGHYSQNTFFTTHSVLVLIASVFLIVGLFTQVAALASLILSVVLIFAQRESSLGSNQTLFYILLIGVSTAVLFTGPGVLAFDLPL